MNSTNAPKPVASRRTGGGQAKILVVDDDARLRDLLKRFLTENGFAVSVAVNAVEMNRLWIRERFDLLVLDLMLPGEDGLSICQRLRGGGDGTPIIMLTAKGEYADRITGLELGADDYLPKPFDLTELIARVRALLRRTSNSQVAASQFALGDLVLDVTKHRVTREGEEIPLTKTEFSLLQVLLEASGAVVERGSLMQEVWGFASPTLDSNLDTYVSYVRRKTEAGGRTRLVHTVRGVGFIARVEDS